MKSRTRTSLLQDRARSPRIRLLDIDIDIARRAVPLITDREVKRILMKVLGALKQSPGRRQLSIAWINPVESQRLNKLYRRKARPTNVLSFEYGTTEGIHSAEIVLCTRVIKHEAGKLGITSRVWAVRLLIHGLLHTEGYLHDTESRRKRMERVEKGLLEMCGIDPLVIPE